MQFNRNFIFSWRLFLQLFFMHEKCLVIFNFSSNSTVVCSLNAKKKTVSRLILAILMMVYLIIWAMLFLFRQSNYRWIISSRTSPNRISSYHDSFSFFMLTHFLCYLSQVLARFVSIPVLRVEEQWSKLGMWMWGFATTLLTQMISEQRCIWHSRSNIS